MASLRELAQQALRPVEHQLEQEVEQLEHRVPAFHGQDSSHGVVEHRFPQKSATNSKCSTVPVSRGWNVGTLPTDIVRSLSDLSRLPCPARVNPHTWREVVQDCRRLCNEGWAGIATRLGWSPLDLFGAVPDKHGDPDADGLAVKLRGRPVLAICASFATVSDGPGARSFIYRANNRGAILMWNINDAPQSARLPEVYSTPLRKRRM
jgi:hypothetical protein